MNSLAKPTVFTIYITDDDAVISSSHDKLFVDETLAAELALMVQQNTSTKVTIDFTNIDTLASGAIGTLFGLHRTLPQKGRRLILRNVNARIMTVLQTLRMDTLFTIMHTPTT